MHHRTQGGLDTVGGLMPWGEAALGTDTGRRRHSITHAAVAAWDRQEASQGEREERGND